jgi:hypothetical protein
MAGHQSTTLGVGRPWYSTQYSIFSYTLHQRVSFKWAGSISSIVLQSSSHHRFSYNHNGLVNGDLKSASVYKFLISFPDYDELSRPNNTFPAMTSSYTAKIKLAYSHDKFCWLKKVDLGFLSNHV